MRELSVPSAAPEPHQRNVADYAFANAAARPDRVALRRRDGAAWTDVTAGAFAAQVTALARGLLAAGIARGDRVVLMGRTGYEWTLTDVALLAIGAVVVPVYETSSADQVAWILTDSGAVAAFAETPQHAALIESVRTPELGPVWCFDDRAVAMLAGQGDRVDPAEVTARREHTALDDLASLIYTSGTTGRPKGCRLTHRNFVAELGEVIVELEHLLSEGNSILLFLPTAHVLGRVIELGALASGCVLGHTADLAGLLDDLARFRPTFVLSVPRVFEKVYNTARQRAHGEGHGRIFDRAEAVAVAYSQALDAGRVPFALRAQRALFDVLVYRKIRAALGGECVAAVSGGAPLGERLGHFFRGLGITVYEGYGLTETTAAICVNRPGAVRIGTVGRPVGGTSVRVADDGELLFRSPLVFDGYWRDETATKEAVDEDGWFRSGDLGDIDEDGFVRVTGRKKELIVTASGKNVAPAVLEDRVRAHWLVSQCLVVGDGRPFVGALITIDAEAFPAWLAEHGLPAETQLAELVGDPRLHDTVQEAVDAANRAVSRAESIRAFRLLPGDWTEAGGQLTPSLKLKRPVVMAECAGEIEAIYSSSR